MAIPDPHILHRFVKAQAEVFDTVLRELTEGRKRTHWMWFIFPQLRGLGLSPTAQFYGIATADEAAAYLAHPLLGERLVVCTTRVLGVRGRTLHEIFGTPDDVKFRSCMTLFEGVASGAQGDIFRRALAELCDDQRDERTISLLAEPVP